MISLQDRELRPEELDGMSDDGINLSLIAVLLTMYFKIKLSLFTAVLQSHILNFGEIQCLI